MLDTLLCRLSNSGVIGLACELHQTETGLKIFAVVIPKEALANTSLAKPFGMTLTVFLNSVVDTDYIFAVGVITKCRPEWASASKSVF